ncbi:MAG: GDP-mannose 4,6-dehydratase [Deltaproteobacteria bacterium]|nr:GDP-mannose 4,6-dehydratase [Deltaproteobacteria bacterium]
MARTLVTGGAGFIGSNLVKRLLTLNHNVLVIDNLSFGKIEPIPQITKNLSFVEGDMTDRKLLFSLIEEFRPEIVIHLAAIHFIPYCNENPVKAIETNIVGTRHLLEACKIVKPDALIFPSSGAVYAISDSKLSEEDLTEPTDIYGISKLIGEDMCRLFYRETWVRTIIARLFNVYGPGETNPHLIPEIIKQLKEGKLEVELGNIEPKRDFINVKDVVEAFIALLGDFRGDFGIFNMGSGKEYSIREIIEICGRIIGKEIKIKSTKSRKRKSDRMHLLADIEKIIKETSWRPRVNIKDGLKELLEG